ncbi:sugar transporter domain-containing protein [Phthorimaea operculella]|nr:sugar transporter domain-containing protein [Phthorimaea operculella]
MAISFNIIAMPDLLNAKQGLSLNDSQASCFVSPNNPNIILLDLGMAISFNIIAMPDLLNAKQGLSLNDSQASCFDLLNAKQGLFLNDSQASWFGEYLSSKILLLDLGLLISFTTIAMPDLLNAKHGLSLNDSQASWFGSISFMTQPLGAVLSGPLVDYFGRKRANFLANVPHLVAWTLMYFSWDLPSLFVANGLLGFGTGVMEAPINSYVGEISEPSIRGALCTLTQVFTSVGMFAMYFLGTVVSWRTAALVCLSAPLASMLLVLLVGTPCSMYSWLRACTPGSVVSWRTAALVCLSAPLASMLLVLLVGTPCSMYSWLRGELEDGCPGVPQRAAHFHAAGAAGGYSL